MNPEVVDWAGMDWKAYIAMRSPAGFENGVSVFRAQMCAPFATLRDGELTLAQYCARYMVPRHAGRLTNSRDYPYDLACEDWENFVADEREEVQA